MLYHVPSIGSCSQFCLILQPHRVPVPFPPICHGGTALFKSMAEQLCWMQNLGPPLKKRPKNDLNWGAGSTYGTNKPPLPNPLFPYEGGRGLFQRCCLMVKAALCVPARCVLILWLIMSWLASNIQVLFAVTIISWMFWRHPLLCVCAQSCAMSVLRYLCTVLCGTCAQSWSSRASLGREWRRMDPASEVDPSLLHVSFLFVPRLRFFFDFIFQSEPRVSSFQMGIVIHSGIHKKWLVLERFHRNSQIIGTVVYDFIHLW